MNKKSQQIFAALQTKCAIQRAEMHANPEKYLDQAYKELMEARDCIQDMQEALSPASVFSYCQEYAPDMNPTDINGEALVRCNAAQKVLDEYLTK